MAEHKNPSDDDAPTTRVHTEPEAPAPTTHKDLVVQLDALVKAVKKDPGELTTIHLHALQSHLMHARRILKG